MYKKLLLGLTTALCVVLFSFSMCFATDGANAGTDLVNGVRNVVGDTENAVENGAKDISDKSKEATGAMENGANDVTRGDTNNQTDNRSTGTTTPNNNDNGYVATRTATDTTFMGMNSTAWTWLIIGIAAIAIIALIWYYSMQLTGSNHHNDEE